ncbi:MAG: hypothetical protein H5T90_05850 [Acetomicrobium sp.]|nr:hypothetical protein [Acetomicrobium sp.]
MTDKLQGLLSHKRHLLPALDSVGISWELADTFNDDGHPKPYSVAWIGENSI